MIRIRPLAFLCLLLATAVPAAALAQHHHPDHAASAMPAPLLQPGQAAFGALQEVVTRLSADPSTDWTKVDIDRLRAHLVDMDLVSMRARVARENLAEGARYTVTGDGEVAAAIRRMLTGHAATMNGVDGMRLAVTAREDGAILTVTTATPGELPRLRALGFFGVLALGNHHQAHHWMMATGHASHE